MAHQTRMLGIRKSIDVASSGLTHLDTCPNFQLYCVALLRPLMLKSGYGRIVNIASISGKDGRQRTAVLADGWGANHE